MPISNISPISPSLARCIAVLAAALLYACGNSAPPATNTPGAGGEPLPTDPSLGALEKAIIFNGTIPAEDGETIGMTVYQPALAAGQAAPLILHGHGFGLMRAQNFEGNNPVENFTSDDDTGDAASAAWNDGYYVISFDQRGFGDSSGNITLMDPDIDGRNVSTIIDWAVMNLSNLALEGPGDPLLGSVGLSYGGGYQTITAAVDPRFDALVPTATWHNLPYSLAPNGIPKVIWLDLLVAAGGPTSGFAFDQEVIAGALQAQTGSVPQSLLDRLRGNSPISFCEMTRADGRGPAQAPALFIQGSRDVLFNLNEAAQNYECWQANTSDARLIVQQDGHIIPLSQEAGRQILFGSDGTVQCGNQTLSLVQTTLDFLALHLRGTPLPQPIPEVCLAQAEDVGLTFDAVPRGGLATQVPTTDVIPGAPGQIANLLLAMPTAEVTALLAEALEPDQIVTLLTDLAAGFADPASLPDSFQAALPAIVNLLPPAALATLTETPSFVPLHTAQAAGALAGIAVADLQIDGGGAPVSLFYGLGVQRGGAGAIDLIDDQVLPFPATGQHELAGVVEPIAAGDVIGLLIYPFHSYYLNNALLAATPTPITVSGTVGLPLHSTP